MNTDQLVENIRAAHEWAGQEMVKYNLKRTSKDEGEAAKAAVLTLSFQAVHETLGAILDGSPPPRL